jgi:hypothetical protein
MVSTLPADEHNLNVIRLYAVEHSPVADPQLEVCHSGGPTKAKSMSRFRVGVSCLKPRSHCFLQQRSVAPTYAA